MTADSNSRTPPVAAAHGETAGMVAAGAEHLNAAVKELVSNSQGAGNDWVQRRKVIDAAQRILDSVTGPQERWLRMCQQTSVYTAAHLFYEWGVFEAIPIQGSTSYQVLAAKTDTEEALLRRLGGVLVSSGELEQTGLDNISHTRRSLDYRRDNIDSNVMNIGWEVAFVPFARFPEYFAKYGRKEPQSVNHVPVTFANGKPELGFYEMMEQDPKWMHSFLKGMAHISAAMPICGVYDFSWLVAEAEKNPDSSRAVLVDVGGGKGQSIKAIREEFPGLPLHRCVLQDLRETLEAGKALNDPELAQVQWVPVDFHKEQPIKGANTYWVRRCFLNYSDEICKNMLRILADSMATDSRLLIQEDVLGNPPNPKASFLDIMMLGLGGKGRTLETWSRLLESAGLHISSISRGDGPWETLSVIEAVKNQE